MDKFGICRKCRTFRLLDKKGRCPKCRIKVEEPTTINSTTMIFADEVKEFTEEEFQILQERYGERNTDNNSEES